MLKNKFDRFDTFIFDLDGTVWWWTEPIPGAPEVVEELKSAGKDVFFITSNCALPRAGYARKLRRFGIKTDVDHVLNPSIIAAAFLKGKKVFVIGEGIIKDLRKGKVKIVKRKADAVLVSEDRRVNFEKMSRAVEMVYNGAAGYKTASGGIWFMSKEKKVLGAGAIAAAIELCTRQELELLGKPSKHMEEMIKALKFDPQKTILFGDELSSDIILGNRLKFSTAFVLSGRDTLDDYKKAAQEEVPDFILKSVAEIIK